MRESASLGHANPAGRICRRIYRLSLEDSCVTAMVRTVVNKLKKVRDIRSLYAMLLSAFSSFKTPPSDSICLL